MKVNMQERKLCTVECIQEIKKIPGADNIEAYRVRGNWWVVDIKGKYAQGDSVLYIETDSWVPHALAPFLTKNNPKEYKGIPGNRLRTIKLKGQISQGLILDLPTVYSKAPLYEDLSSEFGITLWEAPHDFLNADIKGNFPDGIPKTGAIRIQNIRDSFGFNMSEWVCTEKLHGTSCTFFFDKDQLTGKYELQVCSRNLNLKNTEGNLYWDVVKKLVNSVKSDDFLHEMVFQGEIIGSGINGNHYKLNGQIFKCFGVYDKKNSSYVRHELSSKICESLGIQSVPVVNIGASIYDSDFIIEKVNSMKSVLNPDVLAEGIVMKKKENPDDFIKVINNAWLLKHE
jgi:RNA ligase (TIGR02306 family)